MASTLSNSDASPKNPDGPLANSNAMSAAVDASPASPQPLEPSPTVSDSGITHHPGQVGADACRPSSKGGLGGHEDGVTVGGALAAQCGSPWIMVGGGSRCGGGIAWACGGTGSCEGPDGGGLGGWRVGEGSSGGSVGGGAVGSKVASLNSQDNLPFPKTPDALPNFHPCPAPISISPNAPLANSDASPANSDSPLANFNTFPAATDTYPGSPEPREPPPLFPIFTTHHQLNTLAPPTHSGVSRQPQGDPRPQMIPSTYQRGPTLDCNQHPPTPSSSTKPRHHSQHTLKFSSITSIQRLPPRTPSPTHTQPQTPHADRQIISHPTLTLSANSVPLHKVDPDITQRTAF
ncbi:hypothetical protein E4T56_gene8082 [Termitomyces sp. T112]|nr:hypothetical protein E4T56_gene8082 [Termitomyces sp. T112]